MHLRPFLTASLVLSWSLSASAQTWSGTVRDIRSLDPVGDARVCAGIQGRVDLACTTSDAAGAFSVSYPEDWGGVLGTDGLYHLFVESPVAGLYYHQRRARVAPGEADCRLVPRTVYLRGRVVNADTGELIPGMGVALVRPGAVQSSVETNALGEFAFGPVEAFLNTASQFNTYGVEPEDLPPEHDGELVYRPWGLRSPYSGGGDLYALVEPTRTADDRLEPELSLLSSTDPEVYTWVELRLPPVGTVIDDVNDYMSSQIGEPEATGGTGGTSGTGGAGAEGGAPSIGGSGAAPSEGGTGESPAGGAGGSATAMGGSDATGGAAPDATGGTTPDDGGAGPEATGGAEPEATGGTTPDAGGAEPAGAGATGDVDAGAAATGDDAGSIASQGDAGSDDDGGDAGDDDSDDDASNNDATDDDDTDVTCGCRLATDGPGRPWSAAGLGLLGALLLVRRGRRTQSRLR